jgi:hypothetical protein
MIHETFVTHKLNGSIEFGFTFKVSHDVDDTEFDIVVGVIAEPSKSSIEKLNTIIDAAWADFRPTADKIAVALS